jgi:hypothetical protein
MQQIKPNGIHATSDSCSCSNTVERAIHQSGYLELRAVNCRQVGETLVLTGSVASHYLKQVASTTATEHKDQFHVVNRITVEA